MNFYSRSEGGKTHEKKQGRGKRTGRKRGKTRQLDKVLPLKNARKLKGFYERKNSQGLEKRGKFQTQH